MPTPIMHLAQAEEIISDDSLPRDVRRMLAEQRGPFLLGHTAPDVQTISGQHREETHFYAITHDRDLRERARPACEALFAAHPELVRAEKLPPPQAAFISGYIAHLVLDELWLDDVFLRYFHQEWAPGRERAFLHNVLRTWLDRQDLQRINGNVSKALREAEPHHWLPFISDEDLRAWRDWLVAQLGPGQHVQTAEVFAQRMGVSPLEMEAVAESPRQMAARVFSRIPRSALQSFHDEGYARSVSLMRRYIGGWSKQPGGSPHHQCTRSPIP
jgi:hypothetical protein